MLLDEGAVIEADLCEHAAEGPYKTLTASAEQSSAPEAYFSHTLLTVTSAGAPGTHFIKLSVSGAGEHVVGAIGATGLTVTDSSGASLQFEAEEAVTACAGIETAYHLELGIGTYYAAFEFAGPEAGFVILTGAHEEHDGEDKPK